MRPTIHSNDDLLDAERLRQIARRKEQNRNAQRRLRERKEEYTMQLEAQLADLHRRSQSQEEESHFLREALARMRDENQTLADLVARIHQAVPTTQSSHPLPQRASIDLGVDHFATLNRSRNRSQSVTTTMMPHFAFNAHSVTAPWATTSQQPIPSVPAPFGSTVAPGPTHSLPFSTASPLAGASSHTGGMAVPQPEPTEDVAMAQFDDASRTSSISPVSLRRDGSMLSPSDLRANLSRHSSGQTDLTIPSESSEAETAPATKIRRVSDSGRVIHAPLAASGDAASISSRTLAPVTTLAAAKDKTDIAPLPTTSDDVMASCLESIHSLPHASADAAHSTQKTHFDHATSWMASNNDISGQLALSDFRNPDLSSISKPLGLTPGALGLSNGMPGSGAGGDGWSISPWIDMVSTPSGAMGTDMEHASSRSQADSQLLETGMTFEHRSSLASRRGFSGSLKLETRAS